MLDVDLGVQCDFHLAAIGQDVDGVVAVLADDDSVRRRRLGELVDLLPERGDVITRLPQRVRELFVARHCLRELTLRFEQALLERAHPLGCVGQARPEMLDLGHQRLDLILRSGTLW